MRYVLVLSLLFTCLFTVLPASSVTAEEVRKLDVSGGKHEGHWMMVVARPVQEGSPMGFAAIALGKDDEFEGAFGYYVQEGRPAAGVISEEQIKETRAIEDEPGTDTAVIRLSPAQYEKAAKVLKKWSDMEEYIDPPHDTAVNFGWALVKAVGELKMPYRTGLGAVNPIVWFSDIGLLNRNKTG